MLLQPKKAICVCKCEVVMHPLKVTWRDFGSFDIETPVFFHNDRDGYMENGWGYTIFWECLMMCDVQKVFGV